MLYKTDQKQDYPFICLFRYYQLVVAGDQADEDEIFLPPLVSTFSSYYYNKDLWLVFAIIISVLTFIILIILIFLRSRISIAIELIEEASKAVGSNMATLFFPIIPFLSQGVVILWFCLVASFLASSGEAEFKVVDTCRNMTCLNPETNEPYFKNEICSQDTFSCGSCVKAKCVFYKFGPSTLESWFQVYNLFGLFWFLFFLSALGEMVLAGVFAGWYWTLDKEHDLPTNSILASLYRVFRYHLGTLAFGSLVLTFIRMIRVLIEYVEDKLKEYGEDSPIVKAVACMCKCCFYCLENCIRFLNRNASIMTAVYGHSFCGGARRAFFLLARNIARVVVLDKVTDFILFIGKLIVVGLVAVGSVMLFRADHQVLDRELNYQSVPVIIIVLCTYAIASSFFSVYSMAVDTIFLSFLEDIEKHDGTPDNPYFMDDDLRALLGKQNKVKVEEAPQDKEETNLDDD